MEDELNGEYYRICGRMNTLGIPKTTINTDAELRNTIK